jgi:hypothetical protein
LQQGVGIELSAAAVNHPGNEGVFADLQHRNKVEHRLRANTLKVRRKPFHVTVEFVERLKHVRAGNKECWLRRAERLTRQFARGGASKKGRLNEVSARTVRSPIPK